MGSMLSGGFGGGGGGGSSTPSLFTLPSYDPAKAYLAGNVISYDIDGDGVPSILVATGPATGPFDPALWIYFELPAAQDANMLDGDDAQLADGDAANLVWS